MRDYNKYAYLTIAIKKDSAMYKALMDDAATVGTKQYPTVAAMRLKDYYTGWRASAGVGETTQPVTQSPETAMQWDQARADANADAAADEWE